MGAIKPIKRRKTAREIAEKIGVSARTVQRYMAQPRAEFEGQSLTKAKPWATLGVSRATWYRHGKPAVLDVCLSPRHETTVTK
jgi:transcriptional regulator with XRE-family HTH domain